MNDTSAWQGKHLTAKHMLFFSQTPTLFSSARGAVDNLVFTVFGMSTAAWIQRAYKIKFDFLLLLCLLSI